MGASRCDHEHNDRSKVTRLAEAGNGDIVLGISSPKSWQIHRWYQSVGDIIWAQTITTFCFVCSSVLLMHVKQSGSHSTDLQVSQQSLVQQNWIWRRYLLATSNNGQCHSWRDQSHRTLPRWWVVHHRQRCSTNEFLTFPLQRLQSALRRAGSLKESFSISNMIKYNTNCDSTLISGMLSSTRLVLAIHYSNLQQNNTKIKLHIWRATCLEFYYMTILYKHVVWSMKMYFNVKGSAIDMNFSLLQHIRQKDMKCHKTMLLIWSSSEVTTTVFVRVQVFWDTMLCQWPSGCWFWKGAADFFFRIKQSKKNIHAELPDPEDEDFTFLGKHILNNNVTTQNTWAYIH